MSVEPLVSISPLVSLEERTIAPAAAAFEIFCVGGVETGTGTEGADGSMEGEGGVATGTCCCGGDVCSTGTAALALLLCDSVPELAAATAGECFDCERSDSLVSSAVTDDCDVSSMPSAAKFGKATRSENLCAVMQAVN